LSSPSVRLSLSSPVFCLVYVYMFVTNYAGIRVKPSSSQTSFSPATSCHSPSAIAYPQTSACSLL
jgi:hypothetical protein